MLNQKSEPVTERTETQLRYRLMRRIGVVVVLVFVLVGLIGTALIRTNAPNTLDQLTDYALSTVLSAVEREMREPVNQLLGIANSSTMRGYVRAIRFNQSGALTAEEQAIQAEILLSFDTLLNQHREHLVSIRYLTSDNRIWGEITSEGESTVVNSTMRTADLLSDPAYVNAFSNMRPGEPFVSQLNPDISAVRQQNYYYVFIPVSAQVGVSEIVGVIQMTLDTDNLQRVLEDEVNNSIVQTPGRSVLLLDSQNNVIASSDKTKDYFPVIRFVASQPNDVRLAKVSDDTLVTTSAVDIYDGVNMPWRVVIIDDSSVIQSGITTLNIAVVVLSVLLAGITLLLLNSTLTPLLRPINTARNLGERVATGLSITAPDDIPDDEIGTIIRAFGNAASRQQTLQDTLQAQVVRHTRDIEVASRIGREVATLHDVDALLNRSINLICDELGYYHAQVFLVDDVKMNAALVHSRGRVGQQLLEQGFKIAVGSESVIGKVTGTGQMVVVNNTTQREGVPHRFNPLLPETRAEIGLPMIVGSEVIGALDIQSRTPDVFKVEDVPTLRLIADQLAVAIYNARLVNQTEKRLQQIDTLNRQLTRTAWEEEEERISLDRQYNYNLSEVVESDSSELSADALMAPITIRGEVIGILNAEATKGQDFTDGDRVIIQSVAERVALAIENARLFQETQNSLTETSTLYQLSRYLNEANTLADIIQAMIGSVMPDASGGQIWMFDDNYGDIPEWIELNADLIIAERSENNTNLLGLRLHIQDHPLLKEMQSDQVTMITNVRNDARVDVGLKLTLRRFGAEAAVIIPLSVRGIWRGVIIIEFAEPREFNEREGRFYSALIDQAGVAIDNRLLLKQTEEEVARNENLYAASRLVNTAQNMQDLVFAAVATSRDPAFNFSLSLLEGDLDRHGWPTYARLVAQSDGRTVNELNQTMDLFIPEDSSLRNREPLVVIDDTPSNENVSAHVKRIRAQGKRFEVTFPLFSVNRPIALFQISAAELKELSASDFEVYRALTGQMSSQIQIRRLLERTEQALDETRRLYIASSAIAAAQDFTQVYETSIEHLAVPFLPTSMSTDSSSIKLAIMLARPEPGFDAPYLEYVYTWTTETGVLTDFERGRLVIREDFPYGRLTNTAQGSVYFSNVPQAGKNDPILSHEPRLYNLLTEDSVGSLLAVPIRTRDTWYGVIICQSESVEMFAEQYTRFATAIADQIGIAIDRQRLFEQARFEADRAQNEAQRNLALAEAAQLASRVGDDFDASLGEVFERVAEASGFDRWMLMFLDDMGEYLHRVTARLPGFEGQKAFSYELAPGSLDDGLPIISVVRTSKSLIINDMMSYPDIAYMSEEERHGHAEFFGKHLAVPVQVGGQTTGTLFMGRPLESDDLNQRDLQLVETLSAQVAIALENRRLFQTVQNEQKTLSSILNTLPAGVLVLDPVSLRPMIYNEQAQVYLNREIDPEVPFTVDGYNLYRTGTHLHYPMDEMPIFTAIADRVQKSSDDVAVIVNDDQIDLLVNAAPIMDSRGVITAVVAAFQDISNLRNLENTLQENLRDTVSIYEATRQLTEAETVDDVLDVIVIQLALLQPSNAFILMANDEGGIYCARQLIEPLENAEDFSVLFNEDSIYHVGDVLNSDLGQHLQERLTEVNCRSLMTVPMRGSVRDRVIGWMMVVSEVANDFGPNQEPFLTQLSDVASTALDNRYLLESQQSTLSEIRTLYNANTNISRARDIEQLTLVLRQALAALNPDYYAGYLRSSAGLKDSNMQLFSEAADGLQPLDFEPILIDYELPQGGMYIDNLSRTMTPDAMESRLLQEGIHGMAAIHLRPKDLPSGFLVIGYKKPHRFTDSENRYMNTLSDGASIVLNSIILFDQIQNALEETSILYQASRALSDATTPQQILDVVVNYLISPHIHQVFIALLNTREWDSPNASVQIDASWSEDETVDLYGVSLTADQFPAWKQLSTGEVLVIDDIYENDSLSPMEQIGIESLDARSLVIIPLRVSNRAIGAVWLGSREVHTHNDREFRTFQSFSEQASLSMEASYLLEQTDRRARQLETSAAVSQSASQILDIEVLMPRLVNLIKDSFGYDHVQIFLMDDKDEFAVLRASTGEAGKQLLAINHKLGKGSESVIGMVTEHGDAQIALDTADANVVHKPNPYLPLTRSEMALPLRIKGRIVGALDVQSNLPNAFNQEDVNVLTTLAAQISVAIENASLYEAAQSQADKMGFLFEVTTAAASADTLDESLQNVADRLHDMLNAATATIYMPRFYTDGMDNNYITLKAVAVAGTDQPLSEIVEVRAENPDHVMSEVVKSLQPFVIPDIRKNSRYLPISANAQSAVLLPMISSGDLLGLIVMEDERTNAYEYDTLQLLLTLTGSLSAVVQSSLLLEQLTTTNERLRELDRLKSDFLANMSHELRTPLNSIIGFSRVMLKGIDGPLTEMQEQDLTTIYNSGQHLLYLINDILDQAKIAAGKLDIKLAHFEVKPLVEAVKSIGIGLVKDKPISITLDMAPNLSRAYGDEFRVRQVLLNLVSNASKFTVEGSIVLKVYHVRHHETGATMVRIDVIDSGIGIAEKDLPLLFEAFQQIDSSLTRTQGGTGLGLPIAKSLVEMMGGEMTVRSQVNAGSTFSFTLPTDPIKEESEDDDTLETQNGIENSIDPITKPTLEMRAVSPTAMLGGPPPNKIIQNKREILLIEDNKDMVDQFRRALQLEGFEVQTADHPAYAEAMASNLRPTILIMDVNFAGGEGWNILSRLKDRDDTFDIPVIVVTLSGEAERAYQAGAHTFIQRPFFPEDLVKAALAAEKESNTRRILIIDDQPESVRLLTQLLNENGTYRVFSASSGLAGISLVARRRPDLVILDLRMPEMDGFAVLQELRSNPETSSIPVMIVTGELNLNADEQEKLSNVHVLQKTDISQEEFDQFIKDVRKHLDLAQQEK